MSVSRSGSARKYADRPPACGVCGAEGWWNGWREVTRRCLGVSGRVETQPARRLHRARCSSRNCSASSWTVYPAGRYPYRRFELDVVVDAVCESAFDRDDENRATAFAAIGRRHMCSGRSVSRWTDWIAGLTDIEALARECIRIDPDGMPVAVRADSIDTRARAGWALGVFDRFAALLDKRSVLPPGLQPSLVRILDDQRLRHGVRLPLRDLSPPLSTGAAKTAPHGG